jgi:hypothetical protein
VYDQLDDPLTGLPQELAAPFRSLRGLAGFLGRCTIDRHGGIISIESVRGEWFMRAAAGYTCRHVMLDGALVGPRLFNVGRYLHTVCRVPGSRLLLVVQRRGATMPEVTRRAVSRVAEALTSYVDQHVKISEYVEIPLDLDDEGSRHAVERVPVSSVVASVDMTSSRRVDSPRN